MKYNSIGKMYKIIATDLDETLLNSQKHVSKDDLQTISNLNDCYFIIATGRGFKAVESTLKEIGQYNKPNTYLISFNGGVITENFNNRIIYSKLMPYDDAQFLFEKGLKFNVCIHIYTLDCCYTYRIFENEIKNLDKSNVSFINFENTDIQFLKNENIVKVLYCFEDMNYLRSIKKELNLDNKFSISFSSNRYLEFNPKGIDKGYGLKNICDILHIDIKDTIGVGDNINDIELIKTAGLGIGVNNVIDDVKPCCDLILDSTNNDSPITEIANQFNIK